jgi:hypothetical protein
MTEAPQTGNIIAPVYVPDNRWPQHLAEHDASASYSAACYEQIEHIGLFPVIMPERELGEVERQIFLRNVVKASYDATLQQGPKRIDVLSMNDPAHVLALTMLYGFVFVRIAQIAIAVCLVRSDEINLVAYRLAYEAIKCRRVGGIDHFADNVAFARYGGNYRNLAGSAFSIRADAFTAVLVLFLTTYERLIDLDNTHQFLELFIIHRSADARAHVPDRLVAGLVVEHGALDLKGAHTLLRVQHQEADRKPSLERVLGVFKHSAGNQREPITLLSALVTLPVPSARKLVHLIGVASRALDLTVWPAMLKQEQFAGFFVRKKLVQIAQLDHA